MFLKRIFFGVIFLFFISDSGALIDKEIAIHYYKFTSQHYGIYFGCNLLKKENSALIKYLTSSGVPLANYDLNNDLNITTIFNNYMQFHYFVLLDGDCQKIHLLTNYTGELYIFNNKHHWLVLTANKSRIEEFRYSPLYINADVKIAIRSEIYKNVAIYDLYNPAYNKGGIFFSTIWGFYNQGNITVLDKRSIYIIRKNMTGVQLKSHQIAPEGTNLTMQEYCDSVENRHVNTFNRYHSTLVFITKDYYNFSLAITESKSWGFKLPNGSMDGIVGALGRRTIDVSSAGLLIKEERLPYVDYPRSTWHLRSFLMYRIPTVEGSMAIFIRPYEPFVWYSLIATTIFIIFLVKKAFDMEIKNRLAHVDAEDFNWSFVILMIVAVIFQQAPSPNLELQSSRLLMFVVFVFSALIYQFYSASIVSSLLLEQPLLIRNVKDFIGSSLKVGSNDILYNRDFFNQASNKFVSVPIFNKRLKKGDNESFFMDFDRGMDLMRKGGFAFLVDIASAYPIIENTFTNAEICDVHEMPLLDNQRVNVAVQKKSPFRDMFAVKFQHMAETGVMDRQIKWWHARKPQCVKNDFETSPVNFNEFYPAHVIYAFGIFCSVVIFFLELIYAAVKNKIEKNFKGIQKKDNGSGKEFFIGLVVINKNSKFISKK